MAAVSPVIRPARRSDLPAVLRLWEEAGTEPTATDDLAALDGLVDQDPDALLVAEHEERLVGSVIAAWDGWRGSIYRLAVSPAYRRRGLGRSLLQAAEQRLAGLGARRSQAIVVADSPLATGFWRASGWEQQQGRLRFVKASAAP